MVRRNICLQIVLYMWDGLLVGGILVLHRTQVVLDLSPVGTCNTLALQSNTSLTDFTGSQVHLQFEGLLLKFL